MQTIGVIGAGAWGTALGQVLAKSERDVTIWAREPEIAASIGGKKENPTFLPGILLSKNLKATNSLSEIAKKDVLLLVTPAQHLRATLETMKGDLKDGKPLVICAKGVELNTGLLLSQVIEQVTPQCVPAVLSGPTFAGEIARGLPAAATIAVADKTLGKKLQEIIGVKNFRPYVTDDVIGSQLGGALKNVVAIGCGIVVGRKMGDSARAALLTRGTADIARLGEAMGAQRETLLGMCGIGDMMLTCSSMQSRNYSLGVALGEGKTLEEILGKRNAVTEGVHTAKAALELAKKHKVEIPVIEAVSRFLNDNVPIEKVIEELLSRPFKDEFSKI